MGGVLGLKTGGQEQGVLPGVEETHLVVALWVHAVVVLPVLVGAVHVPAVLTPREPGGKGEGDVRLTSTMATEHSKTKIKQTYSTLYNIANVSPQ